MGNNETLSPTVEVDNPFAEWGDKEEIASEFENTPEVDLQEVKNQLIDFFGPSQQFSYMSYHGTVTEMMNLCTGIDHILQGGFDVAKEWLSSYAVFETNEEDANDKEMDDAKQVDNDTSKNIHDTASSDQKTNGNESKNEGIQTRTSREHSIQLAVDHAKQVAEESTALASVISLATINQAEVEETKEFVESEVAIVPAVVAEEHLHVHKGVQNESVEKPSEITVENNSKVEPEQFVRDNSVDSEKNEQ